MVDDDGMGSRADSDVSLPIQGNNLPNAPYGHASSHLSSIFYCLISYDYCLLALTATQQAPFLSYLTFFVYCLLLIFLRCHMSILCPQPSFIICQPSYDFVSSRAASIIITWQQLQLWLPSTFLFLTPPPR